MFEIKPFQILSLVLISTSHENTVEVDIKEMPPSKILQGRCVELGASFHGKTSF